MRGEAYLHKRNYEEAIKDFTQAIEINKGFFAPVGLRPYSYYSRGTAYLAKGDYEEAIKDFTGIIKGGEQNFKAIHPESYWGRGTAYLAKGDSDRAISDLKRAIELKSNFPYAYHTLGLAHYNRGLTYAAKGDFDRAIVETHHSNRT